MKIVLLTFVIAVVLGTPTISFLKNHEIKIEAEQSDFSNKTHMLFSKLSDTENGGYKIAVPALTLRKPSWKVKLEPNTWYRLCIYDKDEFKKTHEIFSFNFKLH